jgi:hypothetical protein
MSNLEILQHWPEAYTAFKGVFDTPQIHRLVKGESAEEARKRLRDFDELLLSFDKDEKRDSEKLAQAIADSALKAGIYNGQVCLTGPHLVMLADNMAETIVVMTSNWVDLNVRKPTPFKNVAIGYPGNIKGIAWTHEDGRWETDQGLCTIEFTHWFEVATEPVQEDTSPV